MIKLKTDHIDKTFWGLLITLAVIAVIALLSASSTIIYKKTVFGAIGTQLVFIAIGLGLAYIVQFVPSKWIRALGYPMLLMSTFLCYLTLIHSLPFVVDHNGAYRWIRIGIEFQPSEISKMGLIIVIADLLSRIKAEEDKWRYFLITLGITAVVVFPILVGNLSTAVLMVGIVILMWFLARIPLKYIGAVIAIALTLLISGYFLVEKLYIQNPEYQAKVKLEKELAEKARAEGKKVEKKDNGLFGRAITWAGRVDDMIKEFSSTTKSPKDDLSNDNMQRSLSNVAVMRGGIFGVFPGNSRERDVLPLANADFIYAIIVEETGLVGGIVLSMLYLFVLFRACYVSNKFGDYAATLMVVGLALMITCQALISMLVVVGIGPVTGQPLPLISKGGTSAIITCLYFGIMLCVSREQAEWSSKVNEVKEDSRNDVPDLEL